MFRNLSPYCGILTGLAVLSLCGCGGGTKRLPMAKTHGTVQYKGQPVADAIVSFHLEGGAPRVAVGKTDANGHFDLTTYDQDDGAFIGPHMVTVSKSVMTPLGKKPEELKPDDLLKISAEGKLKEMMGAQKGIPVIYSDIKTTTLKFTIEPGDNDKTITLKE